MHPESELMVYHARFSQELFTSRRERTCSPGINNVKTKSKRGLSVSLHTHMNTGFQSFHPVCTSLAVRTILKKIQAAFGSGTETTSLPTLQAGRLSYS